MPYASNEGVRVHYEIEGEGEPLVLQHGFSNSLELWRLCGYVDALKEDFRCILVDLRGHGLSDKPHEMSAYGVLKSAGDVIAVLDDAGVERAHFWGYSMGGSVGFVLMNRFAERFRSFVIGGQSPGPRPEGAVSRMRGMQATLRDGRAAYIANLPSRWAPIHQDIDTQALISTLDALVEFPNTEPFAPQAPCLIYNGSADGTAAGARVLKETAPTNVRIEEVPGLNHLEGIDRSDLVLPVVLPFLAEVSSAKAT